MTTEIIFYDIVAQKTKAEERAWCPNAWVTRLTLGFKGLPFKTVWVEYPDIADLCKKIGAAPTGTRDGLPLYTLPVIQDPSTGKVISDTFAIAEYLDETYPDRPTLMPKGTRGLQWAFTYTATQMAIGPYRDNMMLAVYKQLRPRSQEYFRATREKALGSKLEELSVGVKRVERWATAEAGFAKLLNIIKKNGEGSQYFMGDTVSFADLFIVAWLEWVKQALGGEEWELVRKWNGGFWGQFVDSIHSKYAFFDEGVEYQP
ncbi:hypothetical protein PUNSTDRAFT_50105 [Punctularia strigosozonata HHB-11173 SS5]|uniref:uncharacterized protein n=1 Tax=Punctularia strigosozonata (strain HHB-11173) TaxID=741275 RepID=UPI00044164B7|nr:uncharacterized protein PUNSTDRAFT_50105 [Punctularia strigosozonata HHB-11173 SS5]EIN12887.1 hypothetical protein PUNSTDRAFT_50105 [Punctularia strigosozonata HHB-11173 SS5]